MDTIDVGKTVHQKDTVQKQLIYSNISIIKKNMIFFLYSILFYSMILFYIYKWITHALGATMTGKQEPLLLPAYYIMGHWASASKPWWGL